MHDYVCPIAQPLCVQPSAPLDMHDGLYTCQPAKEVTSESKQIEHSRQWQIDFGQQKVSN